MFVMFVHCCCGRFLLVMGAYKSCSSVNVTALVVSKIFDIPQAVALPASGGSKVVVIYIPVFVSVFAPGSVL